MDACMHTHMYVLSYVVLFALLLMLCDITLCVVAFSGGLSCYAMSCHAVPYHVMLCLTFMLYYPLLCRFVLGSVHLC